MTVRKNRRERLITPLGLVVAGVAFAGAFALFSPSREAFTWFGGASPGGAANGADPDGWGASGPGSAAPPDALSIAYLRARAASSGLGEAEAVRALSALAVSGRASEARSLLSDYPSLIADPLARARVELEIASSEWYAARGPNVPSDERERADLLLRARMSELPTTAVTARHAVLLERAAPLAVALGDDTAIERIYRTLASAEPERAAHWYGQCGQQLGARGVRDRALACLLEAEQATSRADEVFRWRLERLALSGADPGRLELGESLVNAPEAAVPELQALATVLLANEMPALAARAYARLAEQQPQAAAQWLPEAARWWEAAGHPARAAALLDRLVATGPLEDGEADQHRRQIERLLLAAGDEASALELVAARVEADRDDVAVLEEAIRMARAAGKVARALQWNTAYLERHPDARDALDRQIELLLAVGNPALALRWAEQALDQSPDDAEQRRRMAQLAEWTSAPELALEQQRWLAKNDGDTDAFVQVARLAESVRRPAISAEALRELARREAPDEAALTRLVRQYELDGRPDLAAEAIEEIMQLHGETAWHLRSLASLQTRHVQLEDGLHAWERLAARIGRTAEETLARIELHWRLGQRDEAAELATLLVDMSFAGPATDHQAMLLSQIGWQYRNTALTELAAPLLAGVEDEQERLREARRLIDSLEDAGQVEEAQRAAEQLWQRSADSEFALLALRLAVDAGDGDSASHWLSVVSDDAELVSTPGYWSLRAGVALSQRDNEAAGAAYERAVQLAPRDVEANSGLLWMTIGQGDAARLRQLLDERLPIIGQQPVLWPAIAIAHLEVGDAAASLPWFEKALESVGSDYGLVLSWADALEQSGQVDRGRQVRAHAVQELRTRLADGVAGHEDEVLRQYGQVLARYGRPDDNEAWMRLMLATDLERGGAARSWREDMAIAWLMSTERHDHARMIMARRHDERLVTPIWQDMALALHVDDRDAIAAMLASGTGLTDGSRMLALRRTGRDAEAFSLALRTLQAPANPADLAIAQAQYVDMRRLRPSHVTAGHGVDRIGELSIAESVFSLRHTPGVSGPGIAIDVTRSRFSSDTLVLGEEDESANLRLGLFRRDSRTDLALSVGVDRAADEELVYSQAEAAIRDRSLRHELGFSLGWHEPADESAELRLAGRRDRLAASLDSSLGTLLFTRMQLEATELSTREDGERFASGRRGQAEIGVRDTFGSLAWSTSVAAEHRRNDRADRLPAQFVLSTESTLDRVLPDQLTGVTLNASLSRGGVGSDFPDIGSPRWFVASSVGHVWPEREIGLQLDAGAGVRVLGNDELGIELGHGERFGADDTRDRKTRLGVNYRYHF